MTSKIKPLPVPAADQPGHFDIADAAAIKACYSGEATPDQQKRAMEWIIKSASQIGAQSYRAGDSHATAFADGRRFVGIQIHAIITISAEELRKRTTTNGN